MKHRTQRGFIQQSRVGGGGLAGFPDLPGPPAFGSPAPTGRGNIAQAGYAWSRFMAREPGVAG